MSFGTRYGGAALVTGASAGIGEAFARAFAADGTDVVLVARRGDRLERLARSLAERFGVAAHALALDLTASGAVPSCVAFVRERGIAIGILVNNAGFGVAGGLFHEVDGALEERMVDLHCRVPVALAHAFLPGMIARGRGAMIVVASTAGHQATPAISTYGASKAFDLHFGEALAAEMKPYGVDVLALSPGYTRTEFHTAAGVSTAGVPPWAMADPDDVVRTGLRALGRTSFAVHGIWNRAQCALVRLVPRSLSNRIVARVLLERYRRRRMLARTQQDGEDLR